MLTSDRLSLGPFSFERQTFPILSALCVCVARLMGVGVGVGGGGFEGGSCFLVSSLTPSVPGGSPSPKPLPKMSRWRGSVGDSDVRG